MRLTIIVPDKTVYVDGVSYSSLTLADIPQNVHALQWNETKGWLEFLSDDDGVKPANEKINSLPQWALNAVSTWEAAKIAKAEEIAAIVAEAQAIEAAQQT